MSGKGKYRAPALQKGLEILELLATSRTPMPMADISNSLGRSISEIFRMLQVLEEHGYLARSGEGYRLTNRLFLLGMSQPPVQELVSAALPIMRGLATETGQSCHLAVASGAEMVVVANIEAPGLLGFSVRLGYRRPLVHSASGHVLLAFQSETALQVMLAALEAARIDFDARELTRQLAKVRKAGCVQTRSPVLNAITDISAPIGNHNAALAALTIPVVEGPAALVPKSACVEAIRTAAETISAALHQS